jgi:hypothetical protein
MRYLSFLMLSRGDVCRAAFEAERGLSLVGGGVSSAAPAIDASRGEVFLAQNSTTIPRGRMARIYYMQISGARAAYCCSSAQHTYLR